MNEVELRPWGTYEVLLDSYNCKVKRITVFPKQRLSYQSHNHRSETWIGVEGMGLVTINGYDQTLNPKSTIYIEQKQKHRIQNISNLNKNLVFIEVQHSNDGIFDESDIIRYEDDYKRI